MPAPAVPPFVDAAWLDARSAGGSTALADVRWYPDGRSPAEAFAAGHLPGAVRVDVDEVLAGPPSDAEGRHPLPAPDAFLRALAALGLGGGGLGGEGQEQVVVAYDDAGGVIAARLVWMLRALGRPAALLDGGLLAWREAGRPVETGAGAPPSPVEPGAPLPTAWPAEVLADVDDAARAGTAPGAVLLDGRPAERFAGGPDALDPRAGHVPGAVSLPVREDVDAHGRLLPDDVLRERLAAAGVVVDGSQEQDVVSSCGSGVTACHRLLVLEHLGVAGARLWPGSWSQWSRDPARPAAIGR